MTTKGAWPSSDPATRKALAADSRVALLEALAEAARPLDAPEAGARVGLHRNTARVHLEHLADAGLVERRREQRARPGRPRVLYSAAPGPERRAGPGRAVTAGDHAGYRELARVLAAQLAATADPAGEAERAGRRWAAAMGAPPPGGPPGLEETVEQLTGIMDRLGFGAVADDRRILLRRCPFADLAREQRDVVCGVHLGMLRQSLDAMDSPVEVGSLDPLVQSDPLLCVVHLADRPPDRAGR